MEITKAFSLRINELIDETGLSLENLSRAAGVSVFTLFHLKGQNNPKLPSTKVLLNLADYFKCPKEEIEKRIRYYRESGVCTLFR